MENIKHNIEYIGVLNICGDEDDPYAKKYIEQNECNKFAWFDYFSEKFRFFRSIGEDINQEVNGVHYQNEELSTNDPDYLILKFISAETPTAENAAIVFNTKNIELISFDWNYGEYFDKVSYKINLLLKTKYYDDIIVSSFKLRTGENILNAFDKLPTEEKLLLEILNPSLIDSLRKSINKINEKILEREREVFINALAC